MKKLKCFLCFMVITTMMIAVISGCKSKDAEDTNVSENESIQHSAQSNDIKKEGPSWSWDTSPITIDWFIAYDWYNKKWNTEKNVCDRMVTEKTGVKLNISTGNTDKLNAMIASNSLPDVLTFDAVASQRVLLENNKKVLALNKLIEKYAPTFKPPKSMMDWYRNQDGNWYAFPSFYYAPEHMGDKGYLVTHNRIFARKDIMEQLDIKYEDFETKQSMLNALKKVKEAKISYNGKIIQPYLGSDVNFMAEQFGRDRENENGDYLELYKQPETLEAIKFYNELFRNGLMTTEDFTLKKDQKDQKFANGNVFCTIGWLNVERPGQILYNGDNKALYTCAGPVRGDSGKDPLLSACGTAGWTGTLITSKAKNPDRIIRFFEFMYSDEISLTSYHGLRGVVWDMVDDKVKFKEEVKKEFESNYNIAFSKYVLDFGFFTNWLSIQKHWPEAKNDLEREFNNSEIHSSKYVYDDKCFTSAEPKEEKDLLAIKMKMEKYWEEQTTKMILAKNPEDVDKIYEESLKRMDVLGAEKLHEYHNKKFKENKARLGIKHAWPRFNQ